MLFYALQLYQSLRQLLRKGIMMACIEVTFERGTPPDWLGVLHNELEQKNKTVRISVHWRTDDAHTVHLHTPTGRQNILLAAAKGAFGTQATVTNRSQCRSYANMPCMTCGAGGAPILAQRHPKSRKAKA